MSETTGDPNRVSAATAGAEAVATLHDLNAHCIRAFVESDTAWYREHLGDDFSCTLADGVSVRRSFSSGAPKGPA